MSSLADDHFTDTTSSDVFGLIGSFQHRFRIIDHLWTDKLQYEI